MKTAVHTTLLLILAALIAGCTSPDGGNREEKEMGIRKQKSLLAKARPLQEFNFSPSFPFGTGLPYIGGTLLQPNQRESKSFIVNNEPIIEMQGASSGRKLKVLLDTASNASWMQYSCAKKNDLTFLKNNGQVIPYLGTEVTDGMATYAGVIPLLQIGSLTLNNTPFYIRMAEGMMQPVVYNTSMPRTDAVLGYDNLRQFQYIRFDLVAQTVEFSTSIPFRADEERLMGSAEISAVCRDKLAVSGSIFGQPVPIVLDFAGDYAFARGDTRDRVTKQVELGEIVYIEVPTQVITMQDRYPRAGRRMLEKYVVTICPREGVVYFERP